MIDVIFSGVVYVASLVGCYDGDSCTLRFESVPTFLQTQQMRFVGFDAPEIRGKCEKEKRLAKKAREITLNYMRKNGTIYLTGERGKYGRLLAESNELEKILIDAGLAHPYSGDKRKSWC